MKKLVKQISSRKHWTINFYTSTIYKNYKRKYSNYVEITIFFFHFREMNINYLWVFFFFILNHNSVASGELKILPSVLTRCSHCFINGENDLSCITVSFVSCQQMCSILVHIHIDKVWVFILDLVFIILI